MTRLGQVQLQTPSASTILAYFLSFFSALKQFSQNLAFSTIGDSTSSGCGGNFTYTFLIYSVQNCLFILAADRAMQGVEINDCREALINSIVDALVLSFFIYTNFVTHLNLVHFPNLIIFQRFSIQIRAFFHTMQNCVNVNVNYCYRQ